MVNKERSPHARPLVFLVDHPGFRGHGAQIPDGHRLDQPKVTDRGLKNVFTSSPAVTTSRGQSLAAIWPTTSRAKKIAVVDDKTPTAGVWRRRDRQRPCKAKTSPLRESITATEGRDSGLVTKLKAAGVEVGLRRLPHEVALILRQAQQAGSAHGDGGDTMTNTTRSPQPVRPDNAMLFTFSPIRAQNPVCSRRRR